MASAPSAIQQLSSTLNGRADKPKSYVFLGIVGDVNHSFGYHLAPSELLSSDYSLQTVRDKRGALAHPGDASAWDLGFNPADMTMVTTRLVNAAKAEEPGLASVREFCGTTNGRTPHPYDLSRGFDDPNNTMGWDASHVTHVHISFYRDVCEDYAAMQGVLDVICGVGSQPVQPEEEEMLYLTQIKGKDKGYITGPGGVVQVDSKTLDAAHRCTGRPVQTVDEGYMTQCHNALQDAVT